jgi:hypothetical protein
MTEHVVSSSSPIQVTPGHLLMPLGWATQPVITMLAADATLLSELLALERPRMHAIAMALAHLDAEMPANFGPILFRAPIRQFMQQVLGRSVPGIKGVLRRLPVSVLSRENYRRLIELLGNPRNGKVLRSAIEIDDANIEVLHAVPAPLRSVVGAVLGRISGLDGFADGLRLLVGRGAASSFEALVADLAAHRQPCQFVGRVRRLVAGLSLPEALPPAQIGKARRLDQADTVRRLAKAWRNCLADYVWQIDSGGCVIYLWDDAASPAACHVRRAGRLGWTLCTPLGPRNTELGSEQLALIYRTFAAAGVWDARATCALDRIIESAE